MATLAQPRSSASQSLVSLLRHGLAAGIVIFLAALALGSPVIAS